MLKVGIEELPILIKKKLITQLLVQAGATGFEPAVSALTGPHVEPTTPRPRTSNSLS